MIYMDDRLVKHACYWCRKLLNLIGPPLPAGWSDMQILWHTRMCAGHKLRNMSDPGTGTPRRMTTKESYRMY